MFQAQLICENCGFASDSFVVCYHPPSDSVDIVLQSLVDSGFRIVPYEGVARRLGSRPTEQELDAAIERVVSETRRRDEERVNVWASPDDFVRRKCPKCGKQKVTLKMLGIL